MKRKFTIYALMLATATCAVSTFSSCGKKSVGKAPVGETEILVACSGKEYFTDKKTFRANSVGESMDQVASKKKALSNARAEIAASIQTTVKSVTDNYLNSRTFNQKEEVEQKYENLGREIVDQQLSGVKTICEKLMKTADGNYKTYIAIELSSDELLESYNSRMNKLSKDERLKIDYDYEKFKKTFDEEMEKRGK